MIVMVSAEIGYQYLSWCFNRSVSALECLLLADGFFNTFTFCKEYLSYALALPVTNVKQQGKLEDKLLNSCQALYTASTFDRYVLYTWSYFASLLVKNSLSVVFFLTFGRDINDQTRFMLETNADLVFKTMLLLCSVPHVQNSIISLFEKQYTSYKNYQKVFLKYAGSKCVVKSIENLDPGINKIKNYQIFVLYHILDMTFAIEFLKSYALVCCLGLLRSYDATYYLYKAIKLGYYYKSGYLFNVQSKKDAIYIVNVIVDEKRWSDLCKLDVVHAIQSLTKGEIPTVKKIHMNLLEFFSVWSCISILKILNIHINILFMSLLFFRSNRHFKDLMATLVILNLIRLNVNDIIIGFVYLGYDVLFNVLQEFVFFIQNRNDILTLITNTKG